MSDWVHLTTQQNGFIIAIDNIFNAGVEIVRGIVEDWDCTFKDGVATDNYIGDIFGSLGGEPDFGFGSITGGEPIPPFGASEDLAEREMRRRNLYGARSPGKM